MDASTGHNGAATTVAGRCGTRLRTALLLPQKPLQVASRRSIYNWDAADPVARTVSGVMDSPRPLARPASDLDIAENAYAQSYRKVPANTRSCPRGASLSRRADPAHHLHPILTCLAAARRKRTRRLPPTEAGNARSDGSSRARKYRQALGLHSHPRSFSRPPRPFDAQATNTIDRHVFGEACSRKPRPPPKRTAKR